LTLLLQNFKQTNNIMYIYLFVIFAGAAILETILDELYAGKIH
jgi:hypothetical protein